MSYTIIDLEKDIEQEIHKLADLRAKKGHDYSGTDDTLDNLREYGSFGVLVRLTDKVKRLKHFYKQGTLHVKDEKVEDTMNDLINYALYLKILWQQEQPAEQAKPVPEVEEETKIFPPPTDSIVTETPVLWKKLLREGKIKEVRNERDA